LKYLHNKNDPEKAEKMKLSWRTSKAKSYNKKERKSRGNGSQERI
jgi:hypothetical protein